MRGLTGLSSSEVEEKLRIYGFNTVPEKKESTLKIFVKKLQGLTAYTIEAAAVISFILGRYIDAAIMILLLLLNAFIGVLHEQRAGKAVEMLKSRLKIVVKALRDGEWRDIPSEYIVPGDVVKVRLGDIIPADGVVLEGHLLVDESTLTGESMPVEKNPGDPVYAGTAVARGEAIIRITATGPRTRYGRTVELVEAGKPRLLIEEITSSITRWLLAVDVFFVVLVVVRLLITQTPVVDALPFTLTLLIASIPIALPAMTTITLALGSVELARAGVIVRRLEAVEAASMMEVICLDKTGTITENKLVVKDIIPLREGFTEHDVILYAALASEPDGRDPIDKAILEKAGELGVDLGSVSVMEFKPFSPESKRSEALVSMGGRILKAVKGAPQVLVDVDTTLDRERFNEAVRTLGDRGMRPLAVGVEENGSLRVIGLIGIYDKPREDSQRFIEEIKSMGVKPVMVTGDNYYVAKSIARSVGIEGRVVSLKGVPREELADLLDSAGVFAEVVPEDKYEIVRLYQSKGKVVGMTGDGVNDAPALKQADLGVAVSNATDIAKSVASVVLTKPGLGNIVDVIRLGRVVYRRIVVWAINKIVKTFQVVYFVSASTLLLGAPILTPTHMILMLFLYDFVTLSISTDRLRPSSKPEKWNVRRLVKVSVILGLVKIAELFLALYLGLHVLSLQLEQARTFVFYTLLTSGLFNILNFRETGWFWHSKPSKVMTIALTTDILAGTIIAWKGWIIQPIPPPVILIAFVYTVAVTLILTDAVKIAVFKLFKYS
ncbi:ATPase, P-type (transporting), HAD superfamily, subfamily IC [Desulfurococcus mucosus DSM 2162]|uniref:ATPase, P-type (Transporting), HAD superfamily, subfamily IC n=2 Tax=Desulfurococcus mucosus TaxID=2275 RepID=E8R7I1_DESM0|nr:ATPase, P-type (transporting), HAD superfamily, subfamily IC [Desulfurococcus mucosus DSM 2162]